MLKQQTLRVLSLVRLVALRFREDRCSEVAASLTFTTLLALVPLITIAVALLSAFPVFFTLSTDLKIFLLTHMAPAAAGKIITGYMQQFADNAARLTAAGLVFLAITALVLISTIDRALNTIFRVARPRAAAQRVVVYWAVLTLGPVLVGASVSLTSWLVSSSVGVVKEVPGGAELLLRIVPIILTTAAFSLLFFIVPNRPVAALHALVGGVAAAALFEAMKRGFAAYIAHFPTYQVVYGTFAVVPIFLVWVYLSWIAVLLGAVITAALGNWNAGNWRRRALPAQQLLDALTLGRALAEGLRNGSDTRFGTLRRQMAIGPDDLENLLWRFQAAGWARPLAGGGWTLVRDPAQIRVGDVYRLVMQGGASDNREPDASRDPLIEAVMRRIDQPLDELYDFPLGGAPVRPTPQPENPGLPQRSSARTFP